MGKRVGEVVEAGGLPARHTINTLDIMEDALNRAGPTSPGRAPRNSCGSSRRRKPGCRAIGARASRDAGFTSGQGDDGPAQPARVQGLHGQQFRPGNQRSRHEDIDQHHATGSPAGYRSRQARNEPGQSEKLVTGRRQLHRANPSRVLSGDAEAGKYRAPQGKSRRSKDVDEAFGPGSAAKVLR